MFVPKLIVCLKEGYNRKIFLQDLAAGITVGVVAIPLAMAFAIASGVSPDRGLFTAVVAGFLISALGGSRVQIGGPTGAFVVILYGIVQKQGLDGLMISSFLAGILLMIMGFSRLGTAIKFIPYPVITGFTSGIAVIIFSSQIKDLFGLRMNNVPAEFIAKWTGYFSAFGTIDADTTLISCVSLIALILMRRFMPRLPSPIVVVIGASLAAYYLHIPAETIGSRFGELPHTLPAPHLPALSFEKIRILLPDAFTIALLGAIEALLSAVVADGMTGFNHKSNIELVGQGIANMVSVLFGGFAATGAIARTATNIKSGAKTPVAGMVHAITIFTCMWWFAPLAGHIPLAVLASVLVIVSWNMAEVQHFIRLFKAPKADVFVLLLTFLLTVLTSLTVAVAVGVIVSTLLFIQNISNLTHVKQTDENEAGIDQSKIPEHVTVYELSGPFFFGSADRLKTVLARIQERPKYIILVMDKVPVIDATGIHALEQFLADCKRSSITLLFCNPTNNVARALKEVGIAKVFTTLDEALTNAK